MRMYGYSWMVDIINEWMSEIKMIIKIHLRQTMHIYPNLVYTLLFRSIQTPDTEHQLSCMLMARLNIYNLSLLENSMKVYEKTPVKSFACKRLQNILNRIYVCTFDRNRNNFVYEIQKKWKKNEILEILRHPFKIKCSDSTL